MGAVKAVLLVKTVENLLGCVLLLLPAILGSSACKGPDSRAPGGSLEALARNHPG